MERTKKLKVAWICMVSNEQLRRHIDFSMPLWHRIIRSLKKRTTCEQPTDYGKWNTNAIREFENIEEVELHVIFVHSGMNKWLQDFTENGVHYYAVSKGDTSLRTYLRMHLLGKRPHFKKTHRIIARQVKRIQPDIIHIMGAENPPYSPSIHLISSGKPVIVQLQTMLQDPSAIEFYPNLAEQKKCEYEVLKRADFIGSNIESFNKSVRTYVRDDVEFVNIGLITGEKCNLTPCEKQYDFVYFASFISKSVDLAIEAFSIAHKINPLITLDVIGGLTEDERRALTTRLEELGCKDAVTIEGRLPTHEDVLLQIKKSRFALLPLKVDIVSSTIREAMWNGLPVVTTITEGTPSLNKNRETVLLSEIGDHEALAENMIRLINNPQLAQILQSNALITVEEEFGNNPKRAREWVDAYYACIDKYHTQGHTND